MVEQKEKEGGRAVSESKEHSPIPVSQTTTAKDARTSWSLGAEAMKGCNSDPKLVGGDDAPRGGALTHSRQGSIAMTNREDRGLVWKDA